MEKITLAAPASFSIPKKKSKVDETVPPLPPARAPPLSLPESESEPVWRDVCPNSPQFAKLHEILHTNCFDPNFRLGIHGAKLLNNPWLNYRYTKYRKRLKADGQSDKENIAFLQISKSPRELAHIAEHGVPVGLSLNDHLGDRENGVYLATNVDLVAPQGFLVSTTAACVIRVVICKILKGKVKMIDQNAKNLKPTFGYGCHMAKPTGDANKREQYRQQLVYMYEINEEVGEIVPSGVDEFGIKEFETELVPSGILPFAYADVAVDFTTMLANKKLRIPRFELTNSAFYTGRIFIMDEMYAVNFHTIKDESWKPLGIPSTLFVNTFAKWKTALEKSPLLDLSQNEFSAMIYNKEIRLPNGLFVAYAVLTSLTTSVQFTTLIETLTTNQIIGFSTTNSTANYLIPPGELANHLGLPSHIESAFHLIVAQRRPFFSLHPETLGQRMLTNRRTSSDEILRGFHHQLRDYAEEEFRQNISSPSGINAHYRVLSRNRQENRQKDMHEREMHNRDLNASIINMDDGRTEYDGSDESKMRTEDLNVSLLDVDDRPTEYDGVDESGMGTEDPRMLLEATDPRKSEGLYKQGPETNMKSEKDDRTQKLNYREQLNNERHCETHKDVPMDIPVDAERLSDRVVSMTLKEQLSQRIMKTPTRFADEQNDRSDRSRKRDRSTGREREMRKKDWPKSSRDRSSEDHNVSTRRKDDWIERSSERGRKRHHKDRRDDSRERSSERERRRKHNHKHKKDRKRHRSRGSSSDRSTSVTTRNGQINRSKERDRETHTDAPMRVSIDVKDWSGGSSTNASGRVVKELQSGGDGRAKSLNDFSMSTEPERETGQQRLTSIKPSEVVVVDSATEPDAFPRPPKTYKPLKPPARSTWRKKKNV